MPIPDETPLPPVQSSGRGEIDDFASGDLEASRTLSFSDASSGTHAASSSATQPQRIGRYLIQQRLGRGAFGEVFEAWDESLNRIVAIKLLMRWTAPSGSDQWLAEARALACLDHSAIVPVYDVGRTDAGAPFIVSKYVAGGNLANHLRQGPISVLNALNIAIDIAKALGYAHERGFFHRDVKPANILMTPEGRPILADFGLALHEADFGKGNTFVGTPAYMSPEQARMEAHRVDGRCDIYSLGIVLYEMLTGKRPFQAATAQELLDCIRTVEVRPPRQLNRAVGRELDRVCLKALAKRASDRYSTALDLADDLQICLAELLAVDAAATAGTESSPAVPTAFTGSGSHSSTESRRIAVLPRGLRPFDAADADFFPILLPGARDRDGVPESICFWQRRIEERNPQKTFRVGVLLGPSGSGKSSLVRAGLIPRLDPAVATLVIEARPEDFESHLLKRLQYMFPELWQCETLREAIMAVRQRRVLAQDQKLLLVIDQFEQYLHRPVEPRNDDLLDALRQCDGETVQTMLLVRDDFTLVLARFMDELEEPLLQNRNFATVDRFGTDHAGHVLTAFGRAYGTLRDELTVDQQRFLQSVVEELAEDGQLVPVRLALFADIVKDRPWTPATLRALGGARGVGVKFLEERIAGPAANPVLRIHHRLIQTLLAELLPADGELIKARARTRAELIARSSGLATADIVDRTLALLDSELRLVTPRGIRSTEDSSGTSDSGSVHEPAYQLTHDFMVPAIRTWLEVEERATHAGRARARLRELAQSWQAHPEPRRLPSIGEWLSIRWLTRRHGWTPTEGRMMHVAARRFLQISGVFLAFLIVSSVIGHELLAWWQARMLCERLLTVDTVEIDETLANMQRFQRWVQPRLRVLSERVSLDSSESDSRTQRRRMNLALALAPTDSSSLTTVIEQLPALPLEHLPAVGRVLARPPTQATSLLWPAFESRLTDHNSEALPFGALLVALDPGHATWRKRADQVAELLVKTRATQVGQWGRLYQPISVHLLPPLQRMFQQRDSLSAERTNVLELLVLYTESDPVRRAAIVSHCRPVEIPLFLSPATGHAEDLKNALRNQFLTIQRSQDSRHSEDAGVSKDLLRAIQQAGGMIDADCAWLTSLPRKDFAGLHQQLAKHGYSVRCLRPYSAVGGALVTAIWRNDRKESRVDEDISSDQARELAGDPASPNWTLMDFARVESTAQSSDDVKWTLVWQRTESSNKAVQVFFDLPFQEHKQKSEQLSQQGFAMFRFDIRVPMGKDPLYSSLWRKVGNSRVSTLGTWQYAGAFGDRYPGSVQTDIRSHTIGHLSDRLSLLENYLGNRPASPTHAGTYKKRDEATRLAVNEEIKVAARLLNLGRPIEAKAILDELVQDWPSTFRIHELLAEVHFRAGDEAALSATLNAAVIAQKSVPLGVEILRLKAAILRGDVAGCEQKLRILEEATNQGTDELERSIRALAIVANRTELAPLDEAARKRLFVALRRYLTSGEVTNPYPFLDGVEFDAYRADQEMVSLVNEIGLRQRLHSSYFEDPAVESQPLWGLSSTAHHHRAGELRGTGYIPVVIHARQSEEKGVAICDSVWQRTTVHPQQRLDKSQIISSLALALACVGECDVLFDALQDRWGRDVRSTVMTQAPLIIPAQPLIDRLLREPSTAAAGKRNLLLTLGGYAAQRLPENQRDELASRLLSWNASPGDAGLRAAAEWCARQWSIIDASAAPTTKPSTNPSASPADRAWFLNSLGQVMITIRPVEPFRMGSPPTETGRESSELLHWARIGREYALSATEVTQSQFREFLSDPQTIPYYRGSDLEKSLNKSADGTAPQTGISWLDARRFCEWLSEREGIPEDQRCYPDVWAKLELQSIPPRDYLSRSGYRLPTEMEWEYAARAGSSDAFHHGADDELLTQFEWINRNANGAKHPVGLLRPNDWGLFDTLGNVCEWCDDKTPGYDVPLTQYFRLDRSSYQVGDGLVNLKPNVRGGYYGSSSIKSRCAKRLIQAATPGSTFIGFRVAKTLAGKL